jgi:hypothetical protein
MPDTGRTTSDYGDLPPLIKTTEYAEIHRITRRAVWKRIARGVGPMPVKRGRPLLFDRDEVLRAVGIGGAR